MFFGRFWGSNVNNIMFEQCYQKHLKKVIKNILRKLSPNILRMFLENVILPFGRTFWEPKENFPLKTFLEQNGDILRMFLEPNISSWVLLR